MLYSVFLLLLGIYFGQEYQIIPSIRIITANMMVYFHQLRDPIEQNVQQQQQQHQENVIRRMYNGFIYYLGW
jgi:hypothetical protein